MYCLWTTVALVLPHNKRKNAWNNKNKNLMIHLKITHTNLASSCSSDPDGTSHWNCNQEGEIWWHFWSIENIKKIWIFSWKLNASAFKGIRKEIWSWSFASNQLALCVCMQPKEIIIVRHKFACWWCTAVDLFDLSEAICVKRGRHNFISFEFHFYGFP